MGRVEGKIPIEALQILQRKPCPQTKLESRVVRKHPGKKIENDGYHQTNAKWITVDRVGI